MRIKTTVLVVGLLALAYGADAQRRTFYVEEVQPLGISCSEDHPQFFALLEIVGDEFVYRSKDKHGSYPTTRGTVTEFLVDGERCWIFEPERYGTSGCGVFEAETGTLIFTSEPGDCERKITWRLCPPPYGGVDPCHE